MAPAAFMLAPRPRSRFRCRGWEKTAARLPHPEHSDTFAFAPYLRDILGPGHGRSAAAKLGSGPTGHAELRSAALKAHSAH